MSSERILGFLLGVTSISILNSGIRKPPETQEKRIRFLKRTMVEKNGESRSLFEQTIKVVSLKFGPANPLDSK